jgi:hypothetical protein
MRMLSGRALLFLVFVCPLSIPGAACAQERADGARPDETPQVQPTLAVPKPTEAHRFWDRTNIELFTGLAAVRALDYASTRHFRARGASEILLSDSIVDNKPLFVGIEVAATAASVGVSYLFHRTGHHKLERWVSIVHISVAGFGDARNYTLGRSGPSP